MRKRFFNLSVMLVLAVFTAFAGSVTSPDNLPAYYSGVDGKSGSTLFSAVNTVTLVGFKTLGYDGALTAYEKTDVYPADSVGKAGLIWDMYGACGFNTSKDCGQYNNECDCYNREHSIPKSWWGGNKNETYSDIFHLVPTDGYVNNRRSSYAFGEVSSATYSYAGAKLGSGKSITTSNTIAGNITASAPSTVFEPIDQYKGDFARGYFGVLAHYTALDITTGSGGTIFSGPSKSADNFGLTKYGLALLLKWHRMDPVSQKEIDRNNGIQETQGNRNPFIDYPDLVEYIWGEHAGETFDLASAVATFSESYDPATGTGTTTDPAIKLPLKDVNVGATAANVPYIYSMTVRGINLTDGNLSLTLGGTNASLFALSKNTISKADAEAGTNITITYSPTAIGTHTATLTISGCGVSSYVVNLSGTCEVRHLIDWIADGESYDQNTAADGDSPSIPEAPDNCSDTRVFVGWTALSSISDVPADLFTETAPAANSDATYYAVFADVTGSGQGADITASMTTFSALSDYVGGDENVSYEAAKGTAGTAPAVNSEQIRIYQNGGLLTITANNSKKLKSITIGSAMATKVTYAIDEGTHGDEQSIAANGTYTLSNISADKVEFKCTGTDKNSRLYLNILSVSYSGNDAPTYDNYSLDCSSEKVTITFNANGGEGTMDPQQVTPGKTITLRENAFTKDGFDFIGWSFEANGEVVYGDEASAAFAQDTTLYAQWEEQPEPETFTATFMNGNEVFATKTGVAGSTITLSELTPCEGYALVGWSTQIYAADNITSPSLDYDGTMPAANTTYHAVFSKSETTTGGTGTSGSATFNFSELASINNWENSIAYNPVVINPVTITANGGGNNAKYYTSDQTWRMYTGGTVVITSSEGEITAVSSNPDKSFTIANGEATLSCTETIKFKEITVQYGSASTTTTYYTTSPECESTPEPTCELATPVVTAIAGDGQITLSWEDVANAANYTVAVNAGVGFTTECLSYTIGEISHSGTTNTCVVTGLCNDLAYTATVVAVGSETSCMSEAGEVTATPEAVAPTTYTITVTPSVNGSVTASAQEAEANTEITLTVTPSDGYQLASLTVIDANNDAVAVVNNKFNMPASNVTVSATFEEIPVVTHTVNWLVDGTLHEVVYTDGESLVLPNLDIPACSDGKVFVGWASDPEYPDAYFNATSGYHVVTTDETYYAVFATETTETTQSGGSGAAANTVLWAENFAHFGTSTPSAAGTGDGTTIYDNAEISYAESVTNTKGYNEVLAGGEAPELLLAKSNQTWTISGIKTGGAKEMALSFLSNKTTFAVTTETADLTISGSQKEWTISLDEGKSAPETFDLTIKNTGSSNARIDNVSLIVVTAGEGGGESTTVTTYSDFSITCGEAPVECELSGLTLNTDAVTTTYTVGDQFSTAGLIVTASYTNCEEEIVSGWTSSQPDMTTAGEKTVTIFYQGHTATYTITIAEVVIPEYTITWSVNGATTSEVFQEGDLLVLPEAPAACETGKVFVGWTTLQTVNADEEPLDLFTEANGRRVYEDTTYYAVYATETTETTEGSGETVTNYVKVMSEPSDWSGNYLIVYETASKTFPGKSASGQVIDVTIENGVIAYTEDLAKNEIIIASMDGGYSLQVCADNANNAGKYLYGTSGSNTMNFGASAQLNTIDISNGDVTITSNTSIMRYNTTSGQSMFRYYKSTSTSFPLIQLYKKTTTQSGGESTTVTTYSDYSLTCGEPQPETYTITVVNGTGSGTYEYGTEVTIEAEIPEHHHFVEWSDGNNENPRTITIEEDATYEAIIEIDTYTITWLDDDGTLLATDEVPYGETPEYTGETPTKESTDQHEYTFRRWTPEILPATADAIYTAEYRSTVRQYTIRFLDYDGTTVLYEASLRYGTSAEVLASLAETEFEEPSRPNSGGYRYEFSGWDPALEDVTGEKDYTAQYQAFKDGTDFEAIETEQAPVKVLEDGVLYIIREGRTYDATGRFVK